MKSSLEATYLYKAYLPKGELKISACGTKFLEKNSDKEITEDIKFAVKNISLELKRKQILSILGENGSGKSTLLKMLAGLIEPDAGKIFIDKEVLLGPEIKLVAGHPKIKLIHQDYHLFPNISLADNILYPLRQYTKENQQQKLEELVDLVNLEEVSHKIPRNASGGEQQRAAIAMAIAAEPSFLLLDEPFANLDVFNKNELLSHFRKIVHRTGIGLAFVTHDAQDALAIADKVMIIKDGEILQTGDAETIYSNPINQYVAKITGEANILKKKEVESLFNISISGNRTFGLRSENIKIVYDNTQTDTFKAKVLDSYFLGEYYKIIVSVENLKTKLTIKSNKKFEKESHVSLSIKQADLIAFES
ncbi:MAG: ABC transporter ATP-binding protein [Bacteroidetes bacterium]|nr:MAG: ABC transporter ATP-binding protein [Bacteroidota bacterium]